MVSHRTATSRGPTREHRETTRAHAKSCSSSTRGKRVATDAYARAPAHDHSAPPSRATPGSRRYTTSGCTSARSEIEGVPSRSTRDRSAPSGVGMAMREQGRGVVVAETAVRARQSAAARGGRRRTRATVGRRRTRSRPRTRRARQNAVADIARMTCVSPARPFVERTARSGFIRTCRPRGRPDDASSRRYPSCVATRGCLSPVPCDDC